MKRFVYTAILSVFAAVSFSSCQKEIAPANEQDKLVTVTFTADKAGVPTKTAANVGDSEVSYDWSSDDNTRVRLYIVGEDSEGKEKLTRVNNPTIAIADGELTIAAQVTANATYTFRAVYAAEFTGGNNPKLASTQNPNGTTNFDPTADILVSNDTEVVVGDATSTEPMELVFHRKVTVNKMILKNMGVGEKVKSVVISSSDKNLTGIVQSNGSISEGNKILTLNYSNEPVPTSGEFAVFFTCLPNEGHTLTINVKTDQKDYKKELTKTIDFSLGQFTIFKVGLIEDTEAKTDFTLYSGDLTEGDYILYYAGKAMKNTVASDRLGYIEVEPSDDVISTSEASIVWHIAPSNDYWTIFNSSVEKYAASTGAKNQATLISDDTDDKGLWTVSGSGVYEFVNKYNSENSINANLRNNGTYGFACYGTGTGGALSLYKKDYTRTVAAPTFSPEAGDIVSGNTVTISCATEGATIYYTTNGADPTTSSTQYAAPITLTANTTIKAIAVKEGYNNSAIASAEYTIVEKTYDFTTVAELNALATSSTAVSKSGKLTNAVVSFVPNTSNAIIKDGTGSVLFYKSNHGLKQGQTFSGELTVSVKEYNSCAELTVCDASFSGEETEIAPETVSLTDLVGNLSTYQNAYVKVDDLEIKAINGQNITVSNGNKTYIVYNSANANCAVGDVISVKGTVAHYGSNDQIRVWKATDITITQEHSGGGNENNASLTQDEITSNITNEKCKYGTVKSFEDIDDGITWYVDCNTDAANRPWMQMKSGSGYLRIVADSNSNISSVTLTISNASNSSGGITNINKHGDFTGTVTLSTAATGGSTLASGTPSNKSITLSPTGNPSEVYVLVSGAVRIWGVEVTFTN